MEGDPALTMSRRLFQLMCTVVKGKVDLPNWVSAVRFAVAAKERDPPAPLRSLVLATI
jgi:hypothetical protein